MKNRYDNVVYQFNVNMLLFIRKVHDDKRAYDIDPKLCIAANEILENVSALRANPDAELKQIIFNPKWFSKTDGDYRAYFVFVEAYHAIIEYYRYRAVYNVKDNKLENALSNVDKYINPKQSSLSFLVSEIARKRQK